MMSHLFKGYLGGFPFFKMFQLFSQQNSEGNTLLSQKGGNIYLIDRDNIWLTLKSQIIPWIIFFKMYWYLGFHMSQKKYVYF